MEFLSLKTFEDFCEPAGIEDFFRPRARGHSRVKIINMHSYVTIVETEMSSIAVWLNFSFELVGVK